jgi:hypothetical protein
VQAGPVTIRGEANEALDAVTVGGRAATITQGRSFEIEVPVPREGLDVEIRMVDLYGNAATSPYSLTAPAVVADVELSELPATLGAKGVFHGRSSVALQAVTIDGRSATLTSDGRAFEASLALRESRSVKIVMKRVDGSEQILEHPVRVDLDPPSLRSLVPNERTKVSSPATLVGVFDEELQSVTVDGAPADEVDGVRVTHSLRLDQANQVVAITATDRFGNTETYERTILQDVPEIAVTGVPPDTSTRAETVAETAAAAGPIQFAAPFPLTVKYQLESGAFAVLGRFRIDRPPLRVPAGAVWLVEPDSTQFERPEEFVGFVEFVRQERIPGIDLYRRRKPKEMVLHLEDLPDLKTLRIEDSEVRTEEEIGAIAALRSLEFLELNRLGLKKGTWLQQLGTLDKLVVLELVDVGDRLRPADLQFLKSLPALEELRIEGCGVSAEDLAPLGLTLRVFDVKR